MEAILRLARAREQRVPFEMSLAERMLIARLKDRDEEAFGEIVKQYGDRVFSLVYRMIGNRAEAEDLAQDVFITVFKTVDTFRGESKFSTWLLRIATNHCKNRMKYLSRRPSSTTGDVERADGDEKHLAPGRPPAHGHIDGPDVLIETAELERLMQKAIANLDEDQRLLIILRDVEEMSYDEIAEVTGLPEGTIKSRLHRGRMAIKEILDRHTR